MDEPQSRNSPRGKMNGYTVTINGQNRKEMNLDANDVENGDRYVWAWSAVRVKSLEVSRGCPYCRSEARAKQTDIRQQTGQSRAHELAETIMLAGFCSYIVRI